MKTVPIIICLSLTVLLFPIAALSHSPKPSNRNKLASSQWAHDEVKVYFVQDAFTPQQKEVLWQEMVHWSRADAARKGVFVSSFNLVDAGYTAGLIDCLGCLTVTRRQVLSNNPSHRYSFNYLRRSHQGGIVSAWIGLDSGENKLPMLRSLVRDALENSLR